MTSLQPWLTCRLGAGRVCRGGVTNIALIAAVLLSQSLGMAHRSASAQSIGSVEPVPVEPAPVELPEITVFGSSRDARGLLETPNAATVTDSQEILQRQPSTYQELIGDVPGLNIQGGPRGIAQEPNIRGFQDEQIVIRADGVRQNFNLVHRGRFFVDPAILKQVEVLRGGASTLFGSGALGGVISLETKDAVDIVDPGKIWGSEGKFSFNSQGEQFLRSISLATTQHDIDALLFFSDRPMYRDLEDGEGHSILNSHIDSQNALFKLGWEPNLAHRVEASYITYIDRGDTPPNANVQGEATNVVRRDLNSQVGRLAWDWDDTTNDMIKLSSLVYYNNIRVEEDRYFDDRSDRTDFITSGVEITNVSRFNSALPITLSYGIEYLKDKQDASRNGAPRLQAPNAQRGFTSFFAQADFELKPWLTLTPGVRYDIYELNPNRKEFSNRKEDQISPKVSVNWQPNENAQVFASASSSFRAPSLTELYNDGVHFGTQEFPLGNPRDPRTPFFNGRNVFIPTPDLEPERATQFELGSRYRKRNLVSDGDSLKLSVNGYYASVSDFIDTRVLFIDPSTFTYNPQLRRSELSGTTTNLNVDSILYGFEGEIDYDSPHWFASAGITIPRGHELRGEDALGSIPQDRLVLNTGLRPIPTMDFGLRTTINGELSEDDLPQAKIEDTSIRPTPGSVVFDLYLTWQPDQGPWAGATVSAGIDNVTNVTYRIHPSGLNSPGRAFKLAATVRF